jgi:Uma2 family endonuclease
MGMPDALQRYTADEVLAWPNDGNRYEVVDGELLVTPSPAQKHEMVRWRLQVLLGNYLAPHQEFAIGFAAPADIIWSQQEYVQPDLLVVPRKEVTGDWRDCRNLLLAIEVISPSSARGDRLKKRKLYQRRGVQTYWVVDPDAQLIEVWHPEDERPEIITDVARWRLMPDAPELAVKLAAIFAELPG